MSSTKSVLVVSRRLASRSHSFPTSTPVRNVVAQLSHQSSLLTPSSKQRNDGFRMSGFCRSAGPPYMAASAQRRLTTSQSSSLCFSSDSHKWENGKSDNDLAESESGTQTEANKKSPFASAVPSRRKRGLKKKYIPNKAAISLTPNARKTLKFLLENAPATPGRSIAGIILKFQQAQSGEPRMVFRLDFVSLQELDDEDEGVSLEVLEDGETPKPPKESWEDGLAKLYVHHGAFLKVLGSTLDINVDTTTATFMPILTDRDGNQVDPNF